MIPSDWDFSEIGEIARVTSGGTPNRNHPEYWNGDIPWITTGEIDFNSIQSANEFITQEGLDNSSAKLFPVNTLLLAMYGQGLTRGRIAILGIEATTNQASAAIIVDQANDYRYVYYYLENQYLQIREMGHGGNQKNLNGELVKSIPIPLPPLAEQRAIAAILSTWDEAITLTGQLIAALQRRKQALMQLLLTGAVRFPGFEDEWEEVMLGDVAHINPSKPNGIKDNEDVSFIAMADVSEEARLTNAANRKYAEVKNGFTGFQNDDVLIAKITPCFENGKGALVDELTNGVGFGSTEFHVARAMRESITPDG